MIFGKKKSAVPQVVEIEMPRRAPIFSNEIKESLASLAGHPGFMYIVDRLRFEQAVLATKLKNERHENLRDVEFLQSGIFWTNWLKSQLDKAVFRPEAPKVDMAEGELAALDELPPLPESVELVG